MTGTHAAATIHCTRCGAPMQADGTAPVVRCAYCAHDQAVPDALRQNLHRYAAQVQHHVNAANSTYVEANAWQHLAEQRTPARWGVRVIFAMSALTMLIVGVGIGGFQLGLVSREQAGLVGPLISVVSFGGMAVYLMLYGLTQRRSPKQAVAASVRVACPNCGAPGELAAGQSAEACRHCHGAMLASPQVMQRGVSEAALAQRHALLEKYRQERLGMANLANYQRVVPWIHALTTGGLLIAFGGVLGSYTYQVSIGAEPGGPPLVIGWGVYACVVAGGVLYLLWQRARRVARDRAFAILGQALSAARGSEIAGFVAWLNRFWPASYDLAYLAASPRQTLELGLRGFPTMVHMKAPSKHSESRCLEVLVALDVLVAFDAQGGLAPAMSLASVPAARPLLDQCRSLGYIVKLTEGGLHAVAEETLLRTLDKSHEPIASVGPLMAALHGLCLAIQASPARPA